MTNINMKWNNKNAPFLLQPAGKDYIWGGRRLKDDFSKEIDMDPLAETWECSTHPDGTSIVASGEYKGMLLSKLLKEHPEFLGTHPSHDVFPILVKLIDAKENLSVQVHPDDAYAKKHENGSMGKTEMWYVLDAKPGAELVYGFYRDMSAEAVRRSVENGTLEKYLQKIPVHKDDVFFVPSGCVHAIGSGVLIAEIQENSNLTYRLYDYNRLGKDGKMRPIHVEKALQVANLKSSAQPRQPMRILKFSSGFASEFLCRCKYFQVERLLLNTERCKGKARLHSGTNSFQVLLCTDGCGTMFWNQSEVLEFYKGDCVFVPAESAEIRFHGQAKLLKISC